MAASVEMGQIHHTIQARQDKSSQGISTGECTCTLYVYCTGPHITATAAVVSGVSTGHGGVSTV